MAISKEDVLGLAQLARLSITDEEAQKLGTDISEIISYVSHINSFSGESGTTVPLLRNVMRDDSLYAENVPVSGKEEALRAAFPKEERGYNVVRKIIEK